MTRRSNHEARLFCTFPPLKGHKNWNKVDNKRIDFLPHGWDDRRYSMKLRGPLKRYGLPRMHYYKFACKHSESRARANDTQTSET